MATLSIDKQRILIHGSDNERSRALKLHGAGPRKGGGISLPLNLLSWSEVIRVFDYEDFNDDLIYWHQDEVKITRVGAEVNRLEHEVWLDPSLWEPQAQAQARIALGSVALFDDRGMGKTRSVIEAIRSDQIDGPEFAVVVCAKRVRAVWEADIERWWSASKVCLPSAATWGKAADQIGSAIITVLTYDSILNEGIRAAIEDLAPTWLVVDEAHNLKKRNKRHRETKAFTKSGAVRSLPAEKRIVISGSPMPNVWDEVWPLLNLVAPEVFTSYWQFVEVIGEVRMSYWGGKEVSNDIVDQDLWDEIFDRWVIKRDRPERGTNWQFVPVVLSAPEREAYRQMQDEMRAEVDGQVLDASTVLAQMTRLQQLAGARGEWETWVDDDGRTRSKFNHADPSSKTDVLLEMLEGLDRAVVFTRFRNRAEYVTKRVAFETDLEPLLITGGTTEMASKLALARFMDPRQGPFVAVCVFGTISEGINDLVAAHDVFFLDWTTAKDVTQAADRLDRPGQDREVRAVTLYSEGTIDEAAIDRESNKVKPLRSILRSPDGWHFLLDPLR